MKMLNVILEIISKRLCKSFRITHVILRVQDLKNASWWDDSINAGYLWFNYFRSSCELIIFEKILFTGKSSHHDTFPEIRGLIQVLNMS